MGFNSAFKGLNKVQQTIPLDICIITSHWIWQHSDIRITLGFLCKQTNGERGSDVPSKYYGWLSGVFSVRFELRKNRILRKQSKVTKVLFDSPPLSRRQLVSWKAILRCRWSQGDLQPTVHCLLSTLLTLILLTWKIWWAPNNASKWQTVFNSAFLSIFPVLWQLSPSSGTQTPFLSV